ncbi:MAG: ethanolamine utilization protein EutN [Bacteroidetes bacterium]|nr:MAG: ethanolamine utilization protein EutN [Bacteroidota bacterium]
MQLCRVTGTIVASKKAESLRKGKLLVVHPIALDGELDGIKDMLAIDPGLGAGIHDVVLIAREGAVVKQLMGRDDVPANVVVIGIVDDWNVGE